MRSVATHGAFEQAVAGAAPRVHELAHAARAVMVQLFPGVVEVPWPTQRTVGYGVGPRKMSEQYCYLAPQKAHLNLGFYFGAELPDPQGLLEGTGKLLRHVKLRDPQQLTDPALRELLRVARHHRMPAPSQG